MCYLCALSKNKRTEVVHVNLVWRQSHYDRLHYRHIALEDGFIDLKGIDSIFAVAGLQVGYWTHLGGGAGGAATGRSGVLCPECAVAPKPSAGLSPGPMGRRWM